MFKNLPNLFARRALALLFHSPPIQSLEHDDEITMEIVDSIQDLKCFLVDDKMQVALYGSPSNLPDGWMRNCPWDEVFANYPNLLPLDQRLSLQEAQALVPFVAGFCSDAVESEADQDAYTDPDVESVSPPNVKIPAVAFRDWVQGVGETSGFDAKQVKRVAWALVAEIQNCIDAGESFTIGELRFRARPPGADGKRSSVLSRKPRS